jgi:hypothetical protein
MKEVSQGMGDLNESEKSMLNDLEIVQKYMRKVMQKSTDPRFKNTSFFAQANLVAGGILSKISAFQKILRQFYDRSGQA